MTEKDISSIRQMITDIGAANTAEIKGELALIKQEVSFVREQTTRTNGRVNRHDEEIKNLSKTEDLHVVNCPHNEPISKFTAVYRFWKPLAITGIVIACISIAGAVVTASNFRNLFKEDIEIKHEIKKVELKTSEENKDRKADILENTKTINDLGTDNAFKESSK